MDARTNVVARNPAFITITGQTSQSASAVRDFYRTALLAHGYTVELSLGHPVGQVEDTYRRSDVLATVDVPATPVPPPVSFTFGLTIARH